MAGLLIALTLLLVAACAIGLYVLRLLRVSEQAVPDLADAGIVGLAAIGAMGILLNFVMALNSWLTAAILLAALFGAVRQRGKLHQMLGERPATALATLGVLTIAVALGALRAPLHPDTGLYHFQSILWQHEAPIALGIANLDGKLGFNSLWHTIAAMFWLPGLELTSVFAVNALIVILVLFGLIQRINAGSSTSNAGFSRWYAVLCLFVLAISAFRGTGSPNTDYPAAVLNIYAFYLGARLCELQAFVRENRHQLQLNLTMLIVVVALALTVKLSQAALALLPLGFLIAIIYGRLPRVQIGTAMAFGAGLGALWMLRNLGLSGCAAYPQPLTCLHDLPWAVSTGQVVDLYNLIRTWGRSVVAPLAAVQDNWDWVPAWFGYIYRYKLVWLPQVLCLCGIALLIVQRARTCNAPSAPDIKRLPWRQFTLLASTAAAGLVFWFFSGPDIRFAYGNLISAPLLVLAWCLNQADIPPPSVHRRTVSTAAVGLMLMHAAYLNRDAGWAGLLEPWPQLTTVSGQETKTDAGETLYLAHQNGECWWHRPCAPLLAPGLEITQAGHWPVFRIRPDNARQY